MTKETVIRGMVTGIGKFSQQGKSLGFESIEDISVLDPLDVHVRIEELHQLHDGWLNGDGVAPKKEGLQWFIDCFDRYFNDEAPLPHICPTAEGTIFAEWSIGSFDLSLEIDLEKHEGYWHSLNIDDQKYSEKNLNLNDAEDWNWACSQLVQEEEGP